MAKLVLCISELNPFSDFVGLGLLEFFLPKNACRLSPKNLFQDKCSVSSIQTVFIKKLSFSANSIARGVTPIYYLVIRL